VSRTVIHIVLALGLSHLPVVAGADSADVRGLPVGPYCPPGQGVAAWMAVYTTSAPLDSAHVVEQLHFDQVQQRIPAVRDSAACLAGRSFLLIRKGSSIGCRASDDSFTVVLDADSLTGVASVQICSGTGPALASSRLSVGDALVAPLSFTRQGGTLLVISPVVNDSLAILNFQREFVATKQMGREDCGVTYRVGPPTSTCESRE
jgi:hypothetical protein